MRKVVVLVLSLALFLSLSVGSAFAAENKLEQTVDALVGTPYKWAGTTPAGFDCSGFAAYVFDKFGIDLPHNSKSQSQKGNYVAKADLRPGDLVFFNTDGKGISHVGIYLGDGQFVHSATDKGVVKNKLSESYYAKRYVTARRVLWEDLYNQLTAESK